MKRNDTQLNGFWGWIKRHVHSIAAVCTLVGLAAVGATLEAIVAGDGGPGQDEQGNPYSGWRTYEPTGTEKTILDNWVDVKFKPYYQTMLNSVNSVFNSQNFAEQISVINSVLKRMDIIKNYYSTNNPESISQNGIDLRLELIDLTFLPLKNLIANSLQINANQLQLTPYDINYIDSAEFGTLNLPSSSVNYSGEKYIAVGSVYATPISANVNLNSTATVISPSPTVVQTHVATVTPLTPTKPVTTDNNSTLKKAIFFVVAILGLSYAFSDSKKEDKNSTVKKK